MKGISLELVMLASLVFDITSRVLDMTYLEQTLNPQGFSY